MKAIYLQSRGAYRNELHSDTLFGLICWAIRQVFDEARLVGLLKAFADGCPPFLISSAFPCRKDGTGWQPFLPRPLLPPPIPVQDLSREEAQRLKQYKRLRYIPADHFNKFLQGAYSDSSYYESNDWQEFKVPMPQCVDRLHSTIDRLSGTTDGEGNLFTEPEYRTDALYFLLDGEEAGLVENALRFLEDFGWGGGNSVGYGHFAATVGESPLEATVAESDRFITLSLYHPQPDEIKHYAGCASSGVLRPCELRTREAWYDLVVRKGKVGGHFLHTDDVWKRSVLMFAPGSTFPSMADKQMYGRNPIVKGRADGLPFDVQQFGYAFAVGMKTASE